MYIKKLETYSEIDWINLLKDYNEEDSETIKEILTLECKEDIEAKFYILEEKGIINGIGAAWMGRFAIKAITYICKTVRYEWHDIMYFIGGKVEDQDNADIGLFKHSVMDIVNNFYYIAHLKVNPVFMFIFISLIFICSIIQFILIGIFWILLYFFGNKAFRFTNK